MKVWSAIFNLFAVVLLAFLLILFYRTEEVNTRQFEELRLRYAMDYATEAAFRATIGVDDIAIDYVDMDGVQINPSLALETFKAIICLNYDMSLSEENMRHIENAIPTGVLFTRDGYYVLELSEIDTTPKSVAQGGDGVTGGEYVLKWSIKYPYKVYKERAGKKYWYATSLNPLVDGRWTRVEVGTGTISDGKTFNDLIYGITGLSAKEVKTEISRLVMNDIAYIIDNRNMQETAIGKMGRFYLPVSSQTETTINNVRRPTLMMFMQGVDFAGNDILDGASVGGAMTVRKRVVVGFRDVGAGIDYYCYERQLTQLEKEFPGKIFNAIKFFDSMEDAAREGFEPHVLALSYDLEDKNVKDDLVD